MLELRDFFHLPQLDRLVTQITATPQGVTIIAGSDAQAPTPDSVEQRFLPSGRSTIFGIFLREWLGADPARKAFIITEKIESIRVPRQYSRRVEYITIKPPLTFDAGLEMATKRGKGLVVIEHLTPEIAPLLFDASRRGMSVLTQLDTVLRGESVMRQLMPFAREGTDVNVWIVAVQRWRTLCERCKQPEAIELGTGTLPGATAAEARRCGRIPGDRRPSRSACRCRDACWPPRSTSCSSADAGSRAGNKPFASACEIARASSPSSGCIVRATWAGCR